MLNSPGYEPRQLLSQCPLQRARLTVRSWEEAKYSRYSYMLAMEMTEFGCMSGGSDGIESGCKAGDPGSSPKLPLEKVTATHLSISAWRNLWLEEPGGRQSMELQRVGHN